MSGYNTESNWGSTLKQMGKLQYFITKIYISKYFPSTITNIYWQIPSGTAQSDYVCISKSTSIQADTNKVSLMLKKWNGWKWFCDFEEVWRWFENTIEVKDYILLTESNKCQLKFMQK